MSNNSTVKILPWGEEIYLEISLNTNSSNKFYMRHGKNNEGREYLEFTKFGPKPENDGEYYVQKLRLYSPSQWAQLKYHVEQELAQSIGWDLNKAQKEFEKKLTEAAA